MPEQNIDLNSALNQTLAVLVRRRWWLIATAFVISLFAVRLSLLIPYRYRSEATVFIAKPRVPEQYIVPNNTANSMEAVDAITREVLSRARLLDIINQFGLYPDKRYLGSTALTDLLRNDIEVQPLSKNPERHPMNAFLIAFTGDNPHVAQQVATRLTSLFISENVQTQQNLDNGTTNFLEQEVEAAKSEMEKQEDLLKDYKMKNLGALPEQESSNMEVLAGLQMQLQTVGGNLARARQQRTYLQAMLSPYMQAGANHSTHEGSAPASMSELREELARLRAQRDDLLARYSSLYPDVVSLNQRIATEDARLSRLSSTPPAASDSRKEAPTMIASTALTDPAAIQLRSQLEANTEEIEDAQRQEAQIKSQIAIYRNRLTLAPVREQQLQGVMRNYDLSKQNYTDLLNKKTQSELATKLALQQRDEQFQIIDPASLPLKPSDPKRTKVALGGLAAGLFAGLALAFLLETRDRSFHTEKELRGYFAVPLVVTVPRLRTASEKSRRIRRTRLEWAVGCLMFLTVLAAQLYIYRIG